MFRLGGVSIKRQSNRLRNIIRLRVNSHITLNAARYLNSLPSWASMDPNLLGETANVHFVPNLVDGKWLEGSSSSSSASNLSLINIPNPMNRDGHDLFTMQDTQVENLRPFIESMNNVPKSGIHNPLRNVDRYLAFGDISRKAGNALLDPDIADFFAKSIMKCAPKSYGQAMGEVKVTASFLNNFGGDNVRFLARDFGVPGDHDGQKSTGYRWPFGPVAIIAPFNFPLEIPVLQLMGALYMGNKPVLKPAEKVSFVMEQFLRLLHHCGMPTQDVDFLNCRGEVASELISRSNIGMTQFTGSTRVAELLCRQTNGRVKIEDAGFDWKILGPDVADIDYVAWQCDQDAYACSGQKCSAQSILFVHEHWKTAGLTTKLRHLASRRSLTDLTVGPVLTHTTKGILDHVDRLLRTIPGSYVAFGGQELDNHTIPDAYGAVKPTAVFVPLAEMLKTDENFDICTTELFAPFQIITEYNDSTLDDVLDACERMSHHLTAALVSNDVEFQYKVLGSTVNGTTYTGRRARTTGAPQNHWFGPAGDVRGAGIGTPEAIKLVWSCHREIIEDSLVPRDWIQPEAT